MGPSKSTPKSKEINISPLNSNKEKLKVLFNNHLVINVDKESVIEKSLYFRAMLSGSFIESDCGLLKVNFEVGEKIIEEVLTCLVNDKWKFDEQSTFDVYRLACYLQIISPELEKLCWINFTKNLKEDQIAKQLKTLSKDSCLSLFKQKALKFKKSKRPSFNGFYMLVSEVVENQSNRPLKNRRLKNRYACSYSQQRKLAFKMFNKILERL